MFLSKTNRYTSGLKSGMYKTEKKSVFCPGFGVLSPREELEFQRHQIDIVSPYLKRSLILLSAGIWLFYYFNRTKIGAENPIGHYFTLFQMYMIFVFATLDTRNKLRMFINHTAPVFTGFIIYIFMTHYVPHLPSQVVIFQSQVVPMLTIVGIYAFEKISPYLAIIHGVLISLLFFKLRSKIPELNHSPEWQIWTQILIANALGIAIAIEHAVISRVQFKLQKKLDRKNKVANSLINCVFPEQVALDLKTIRAPIARHYDNVTIIFADIVNYTELSAKMTPHKLISMLRKLFKSFDQQAEIHNVEKIKTIGDAYMAACGCPQPTHDHARNVIKFALALRKKITQFNDKFCTSINIRIGIHTGPVVGGVITGKRMSFDLWGDTVNVASRIQSIAAPGMIMVSEKTAEMLGQEFLLSTAKLSDLKSIGLTPVRILHGYKPKLPDVALRDGVKAPVSCQLQLIA